MSLKCYEGEMTKVIMIYYPGKQSPKTVLYLANGHHWFVIHLLLPSTLAQGY